MNGSIIPRFVAVLVVLAAMMVVMAGVAFAEEVSSSDASLKGVCASTAAQVPPPGLLPAEREACNFDPHQ